MRVALYQPDIPQNTGTILRLAACLNVAVDVIKPAGFDLSDRALRRAGMDYLHTADLLRHESWNSFQAWHGQTAKNSRLILLTTAAEYRYTDFDFHASDILLFGRESAGVPQEVHNAADARLVIPMRPGLRSLNVAVSAAMVVGEALRQTNCFPDKKNNA